MRNFFIAVAAFVITYAGLFTATYAPQVAALAKQNQVPMHLSIPKIDVEANVESLGKDSKGAMDVPKDVSDVGWYDLGTYPGDKGNAVIDGHLDSTTDAAVFYKINQLQPGDLIEVIDRSGKSYKYVVTANEEYDESSVPIDKLFGLTKEKHLNLITCGGVWDEQKKEYLQRTVIYSTLRD